MKELFPHYYGPTDSELCMLWNEGVFILDANMLLNPYRCPKEMSADLMQIFKRLAEQGRLWVPYQVALEYQQNLPGEIEDQIERRYTLVREMIKRVKNNALDNFKKSLDGMQLEKRHFLMNPSQLMAETEIGFGRLLDKLEELKQQHISEAAYSALRDEIDNMLQGRVGPLPESQEWLEKIYCEGKKRYEKSIPPGFGDIGKPENDAYVYNGLSFKQRYGDLIIWKQIIQQAKMSDIFKYIAFVTGDVKKDWWWISGTKAVGPLPELAREISSEAGVLLFYMYSLDGFMESAKEHLNIQISLESIEQARRSISADLSMSYQLGVTSGEQYFTMPVRFINPSGQVVRTPWFEIAAGGVLDIIPTIPPAGVLSPIIVVNPSEPTEELSEEAKNTSRDANKAIVKEGS